MTITINEEEVMPNGHDWYGGFGLCTYRDLFRAIVVLCGNGD